MIVIIRIRGIVDVNEDVEETLKRLRLRRKYSCILLEENKVNLGMLKKVKDYVAYGKINSSVVEQLVEKRGEVLSGKKIDMKKAAQEISKGDKLEKAGLKPFFRLHPPRGGLKSSKLHYPKGDLGNNGEKINDLLVRMI